MLTKLKVYRLLQQIYEPGAGRAIARLEDQRDSDNDPPQPKHIKLWLPSELALNEQPSGCSPGLLVMEAKLREAQCYDALNAIRSLLHARSHLITFRNDNVTGQHAVTRSRSLITRIGDKLRFQAIKYRRARKALISLPSEDSSIYAVLRELKDLDIALGHEKENDTAAWQKLSQVGSRAPRRKPDGGIGGGLSWIWTTGLDSSSAPLSIHSSVRVEWAKARARRLRWSEEVDLLREEMKRVLRFLRWRSTWWQKRTSHQPNLSEREADGNVAYAFRQVSVHLLLAQVFRTRWEVFFEDGIIDGSELDDTATDNAGQHDKVHDKVTDELSAIFQVAKLD